MIVHAVAISLGYGGLLSALRSIRQPRAGEAA